MDDETYDREKEHCSYKQRYMGFNLEDCLTNLESQRKQITCCEGYVKVEDECKGKQI